jgi:integrase
MAYIEKIARRAGWRVRYRDPAGRMRSRSFRRKIDAERFSAGVETEMTRGMWTDPDRGKISVAEWTDAWVQSKVDLRPTTLARLRSVIKTHIVPEFGDYALNRVGNSDLRRWVAQMSARGQSPATVRKSFNALSQIMRAAVSDRRIAFNPCLDVPLPAEQHTEQRFLDASEVERLAAEIERRFRAFVLLAVYGGLRFGELAGLRRSRIDVLRGRVIVAETLVEADGKLIFGPPKTKRSRRTVPLPRRIVGELESHLGQFVDARHDALVFTGTKGAPLRRSGFHRCWWKQAIEASDLHGLKVHELRHTFVALWVAAGANPKEVSVRAGHSSVAFTLDRYGHLYQDTEDDIPERLDALLARRAAPQARHKNVVEMPGDEQNAL